MTFDFTKAIKTATGLRAERRDLLNQQQALANGLPRPQDRAALAAAKYAAPAPSIIGGKFVKPGDYKGLNAAIAARDKVADEVRTQQGLRDLRSQGNLDVRGIDAGFYTEQEDFSVPNLPPVSSASASTGSPTMDLGFTPRNNALRYATQPFSTTLSELQADFPTAKSPASASTGSPTTGTDFTSSNSTVRSATQPFSTTASELQSDFPPGRPSAPPTGVNDAMNASGYGFAGGAGGDSRSGYGLTSQGLINTRRPQGMMNGGVIDKPKMVKQPGYKNGGKVKMPGYEMGGAIGPEVTKWAGDKKKKKKASKGMRGYASGGKVGKVSEDDGKDTVDVKVRQGEYMLAPETVAAVGGGDHSQGVRMLDEISEAATGQPPGPVPVNEDGKAMRGFRRGGKMGYNVGGFVDDFGNFTDPRQWTRAQQAYAVTPEGQAALRGNLRAEQWAATQQREGLRMPPNSGPQIKPDVLSARSYEAAGRRFGEQNLPRIREVGRNLREGTKAVAPRVLGGVVETTRQLGDKEKNQFYNDPNVSNVDKGLQTASDIVDSALRYGGGVLGGSAGAAAGLGTPGSIALGIAGSVGGYAAGDALWEGDNEALRQYRLANDAGAADETGQPEPTTDPNPYFRPFGGGEVDLRDMNVVMRTGGPDGEVIVRETIDGVPTFSNLRTTQQGGDAATLQAQADARVAQDMNIRARNNAVVQQMRETAPIYDQAGVAAEQTRLQEERMERAKATDQQSVATLEDLRSELASLGLFTDPETGQVNDAMYFDFIDRVGAELAAEGLDITQLPADLKMQMMQEYAMALPVSQNFNRIVQGETDMNPNAILSPADVGTSRLPRWGDIGWFDDTSDVGLWDIITDNRVNEVNIPGADGTMLVTQEDLLGPDLRRINFFEGRNGG